MLDVEVIEDPAAAAVALDPIRSRLLAELADARHRRVAGREGRAAAPEGQLPPACARGARPGEGDRGAPPRRADRARAGGDGGVLHRLARRRSATSARRTASSARYLIALAARVVREVARLDERQPTLALDAEVSFRTPEDRAAFAEELSDGGHAGRRPPPSRRGSPAPAPRRRPPAPEGGSMTRRIENRIEVPGTPEEVWEADRHRPRHRDHGSFRRRSSRASAAGSALDMGAGMEEPAPSALGSRRTASPTRSSGRGKGTVGDARVPRRGPVRAGRASSGSSAPSTPTGTTGTGCSRICDSGLGRLPADPAPELRALRRSARHDDLRRRRVGGRRPGRVPGTRPRPRHRARHGPRAVRPRPARGSPGSSSIAPRRS